MLFTLANLLPRTLPTLPDLPPSLVRQCVQCGPIDPVLILKLHVPTVDLHQLLRRHDLPHIDIELHLLSRQRINKRVDQLEEPPHDPRHILHASVAEPLRVMILQDRQRLPALRHRRILALSTLLEIDQDRQRLLPGRHQVDGALEHEDEMLHLLLPPLRVLLVRVQVQAGSAFIVVAEDDLLARRVLFGYVVRRVALDVEFPAPDQGGSQAGDGVGFVPFRCAEVAKEALAC